MTAAYIQILFHAVNAFPLPWRNTGHHRLGRSTPPREFRHPFVALRQPRNFILHRVPHDAREATGRSISQISGTAVILLMTRARRDCESGTGQRGGASNSLSKTFRLQFALLCITRLCCRCICGGRSAAPSLEWSSPSQFLGLPLVATIFYVYPCQTPPSLAFLTLLSPNYSRSSYNAIHHRLPLFHKEVSAIPPPLSRWSVGCTEDIAPHRRRWRTHHWQPPPRPSKFSTMFLRTGKVVRQAPVVSHGLYTPPQTVTWSREVRLAKELTQRKS